MSLRDGRVMWSRVEVEAVGGEGGGGGKRGVVNLGYSL